jgi:hypothetical protein
MPVGGPAQPIDGFDATRLPEAEHGPSPLSCTKSQQSGWNLPARRNKDHRAILKGCGSGERRCHSPQEYRR